MEPLSALSVATAIVQFLDFSGKILSGTWRIYRGKAPKGSEANSDLHNIAKDLRKATKALETEDSAAHKTGSHDSSVADLAGKCTIVGNELLGILDRLRTQSNDSVWASFKLALRTIWSENEVEKLSQTLENYRQQMSMHILLSLRERVDASQIDHWNSLASTQSICREVLKNVTKQAQWQGDVIDAIQRSHIRGQSQLPNSRVHEKLSADDAERISRAVTKSLYFPEIERRYDKITQAHQKTFEWIFHCPSGTAEWTDFPHWIGSDNSPLYWVTGKAGAGKSTLMRFMVDHPKTHKTLTKWAGSLPLITAFFFFWNSGSEIQMSHEGLIRALLYQVLDQAPDLVPLILPHRVETGALFGEHMLDSFAKPWTWEELLKAFRSLIEKGTSQYRFAFFIDGMDEFRGNPSEIVDVVTSLMAPGIKVCASSRPWVVFEDAFGHRPHLRLEDLTHNDIKHFVTSKLTASPGFRPLQVLHRKESSRLIQNICGKSSGVFLWVFLVTRSLLEGLSEGEQLVDLQRRLDSLPEDLENLFAKMLGNLSVKHLEKAAQFIQLVRASLLPLSLLDMSIADEEDADFAIRAPYNSLTYQQIKARAEQMRRRLNACCKGLLEAKPIPKSPVEDTKVSYLHRSVKDFLEQGDNAARILGATSANFNVNFRLYNIQLVNIKEARPKYLAEEFLWHRITYAIEYAVRADKDCNGLQVRLLDELDKVAIHLTTAPLPSGNTFLGHLSRTAGYTATHWTWTRIDCRESGSFLGLAVQCQLLSYVAAKLESMPPEEARETALKLQILAEEYYMVFPNERDRPTVCHNEKNEKLIEFLSTFRDDRQKKEATTVASRRRFLRCFCFG